MRIASSNSATVVIGRDSPGMGGGRYLAGMLPVRSDGDHENPVPGIPNVVRAPRREKLIVAPGIPALRDAPLRPRLSLTALPDRVDRLDQTCDLPVLPGAFVPAAYSIDLRKKVAEAVARGDRTQGEVARDMGVGVATVVRVWRMARTTGVLPGKRQPPSSRRRALDEDGDAKLKELVANTPDATEHELTDDLAAAGFVVSRSSVNRALRRLGLTRKKRPS